MKSIITFSFYTAVTESTLSFEKCEKVLINLNTSELTQSKWLKEFLRPEFFLQYFKENEKTFEGLQNVLLILYCKCW